MKAEIEFYIGVELNTLIGPRITKEIELATEAAVEAAAEAGEDLDYRVAADEIIYGPEYEKIVARVVDSVVYGPEYEKAVDKAVDLVLGDDGEQD